MMLRRLSGFTLIELLIALGVMAVFSLMAYRGLDSVLRLHQGAHAHELQAQSIDRVLTQLEADLRQASRVQMILASAAPDSALSAGTTVATNPAAQSLHLQLSRRIGNERASVEWFSDQGVLIRRTQLATGVQQAAMLEGVDSVTWLMFDASWQAIAAPTLLAQPNRSLVLNRAAGVRLSVLGKTIEKQFLMGR